LDRRGILYAPDYAINAGGVISGGVDLLGWQPEEMQARVNGIYDTLLRIFQKASADGIPTYKAADVMAEQRLTKGSAASVT